MPLYRTHAPVWEKDATIDDANQRQWRELTVLPKGSGERIVAAFRWSSE